MRQQFDWATGKPSIEGGFLCNESDTQAYHGYLKKARILSEEAGASLRDGNREVAAICRAAAALREARLGSKAQARQGRARTLEARTSKGPASEKARTQALAAYQDFLTLWKEADSDILILQQAQTEYAELMSEEKERTTTAQGRTSKP